MLNTQFLCLQLKIMVTQTCHTPPAQKWIVYPREVVCVSSPNPQRTAPRQTRWRRAWRVWFVRTCCMIVSGEMFWAEVHSLKPSLLVPSGIFRPMPCLFKKKKFFFFSLQPCMHVFCAACYSGWMERSSLCPTCRCPVERIRKNHILNNLVEAYLIQHPGLHRFNTTHC